MVRRARQHSVPRARRARGTTRSTFTRIAQLAASIAVAVAVLAGVYYGSRLESLQLRSIVVVGGETVSHEKVRAVVNTVLSGSYAGLVPKRFSFGYPRDEIRNAVRVLSPVRNVRVYTPDAATVRVEFSEYAPMAQWCADDSAAPCMFVDADGYAFADARDVRGVLYPDITVASTTPSRGASVPHIDAYRHLMALRTLLAREQGFATRHIRINTEGDIALVSGNGALILVRIEDDPEEVYARIAHVLDAEAYAYVRTEGFRSLDVRFGNRVYLKDMRAEAVTPSATSTERDISTSTEQY